MLDARRRPRAAGSGRWRRPALLTPLVAALALPMLAGPVSAAPAPANPARQVTGSYTNPLAPEIPGTGLTVDSCADPTVIQGQTPGDQRWYMYCTTDPLNDRDLRDDGDDEDTDPDLVFRRIPTMFSTDLVNWTYVGDAFPQGVTGLPSYAEPDSALWAPEVVYSTTFKQYYMFVGVTDTTEATSGVKDCGSDNAIGVATSTSPLGPWKFSDTPVVAPRSGGEGCNFKWTYDPDVLGDAIATQGVFYYGSYYGGVYGSPITLTRTSADAGTTADDTMVAIDNKYEGANVVYRNGFYYIFLSATNCCNGALTGYSVFVGRSRSPLGPFVDQQGNSLTDAQAGGTPFLTMNGNRWVGPGHNTVFEDEGGQWWTIYHAVDQEDPFFATETGFTKRPALLDPIDWIGGWPTVNGGAGPSDTRMPAPAAQPGQRSRYRTQRVETQVPGRLLRAYSDEFSGTALSSAWRWDSGSGTAAAPATPTTPARPARPIPEHGVAGGVLSIDIQAADTYLDFNTAHVLVRDAPDGDYVIDTRVRTDVPDEGCCFNFAQAGVGVYGDQDRLVKLTHTAIFNTRQTEWAKEISDAQAPEGWTRYGNTVVGPPSEEWTYLRIAVEELDVPAGGPTGDDTHRYTAYTSQDGRRYVRGGTWTHSMGNAQQIALFAMGLQNPADFTAEFDYVRVSTLGYSRRR